MIKWFFCNIRKKNICKTVYSFKLTFDIFTYRLLVLESNALSFSSFINLMVDEEMRPAGNFFLAEFSAVCYLQCFDTIR